jgi:hypothetical protein
MFLLVRLRFDPYVQPPAVNPLWVMHRGQARGFKCRVGLRSWRFSGM